MRIQAYSFGRIEIEGTAYTKDLIVFPAKVLCPWWRQEGHLLQHRDLAEVLPLQPEVLIVGTGASGLVRVPDSLIRELARMGTTVIAEKTGDAVERYNSVGGPRVIAALHLTC